MALIYNGTTIPSGAVIKYNNVTLDKIIFNGVEVWRRYTEVTKSFGNHTFRDKNGTAYDDWHSAWGGLDLGAPTVITNVYLGIGNQTGSGAPRYRVYGNNVNSTSGWTLLSEFQNTSAGWKTISNSNTYRYVWLSMKGASDVRWIEDEGGNYYWYVGYDFRVKGLQ